MKNASLAVAVVTLTVMGGISSSAQAQEEISHVGESLVQASTKGDLDAVKAAITNGADVNYATPGTGASALLFAAEKGHLEVVSYLISRKADINKGDEYGGTALHYAVINGHLDIAKALVAAHCNINAKTVDEETPLYLAAYIGNVDAVKLLTASNALVTAEEKTGFFRLVNDAENYRLGEARRFWASGFHTYFPPHFCPLDVLDVERI